MDHSILILPDDAFEETVSLWVMLVSGRTSKRHIKNPIGKIQGKSVLFPQIISGGHMHFIPVIMKQTGKRTVELYNMTLQCGGDKHPRSSFG